MKFKEGDLIVDAMVGGIPNEEIEKILKEIFPDFETVKYAGIPTNPRFKNIEGLKKTFANGGEEVYFKYKLYELVEKVQFMTRQGLLRAEGDLN